MADPNQKNGHLDPERLDQDYPWLTEMLLPVFEKLSEEKEGLAAAKKAFEERTKKVNTLTAQYEALREIAQKGGFSAIEVDDFCRSQVAKKFLDSSALKEVSGKRRLSNNLLMVIVARAIRKANRPLSIEEIMAEIERMDIYLPGKDPRKNMLAYLSRSPIVKSPKKGWYFYDSELLTVAEQKMKEAGGGMEDEESQL